MNAIKKKLSKIFPLSANVLNKRIDNIENQILNSHSLIRDTMFKLKTIETRQICLMDAFEENHKILSSMSKNIINVTEYNAKISANQQQQLKSIQEISTKHHELIDMLAHNMEKINSEMKFNQERLTERQIESIDMIKSDLKEIGSGVTENNIRYHSFLYEHRQLMELQKILQGILQQDQVLNDESRQQYHLFRYIERIISLFPIVNILNAEYDFKRIGKNNDGGYILLNDFSGAMIAYSFGISDDVSWDEQMAEMGYDVYMYDHTIEKLPMNHSKFHYFKTGLSAEQLESKFNLETLPKLLENNGHTMKNGMILKVDIEGAEWDVFGKLEKEVLEQFDQIVIEFHNLTQSNHEIKFKKALDNLNQTHCLIHIHANNYGSYLILGGKVLPDILEATYVRKGKYQCELSDNFYPKQIDQPNNASSPELILGIWK